MVEEVITYLNKKLKKKRGFSHETKTTSKLVNARINDGYAMGDFRKVIDHKVEEWKDDERMKAYLTPDTLFAEKNFEKYLIQAEGEHAEENGWTPEKMQEMLNYFK